MAHKVLQPRYGPLWVDTLLLLALLAFDARVALRVTVGDALLLPCFCSLYRKQALVAMPALAIVPTVVALV